MYIIIKRSIDIVGSAAIIILAMPLFIALPVMIKLDSPGPVFYRQRRHGLNGAPFYMYKFRTMVRDADVIKKTLVSDTDGPMFKIKSDPRVTRVGRLLRKYSIDEMPQLLNILNGDMSLVGPRPLAMEEMMGHDEWRTARLSVKPGLTGLWQIRGRESHLFRDWIKYDCEYVRNKSLVLDLKLLLLTIGAVLGRKNED